MRARNRKRKRKKVFLRQELRPFVEIEVVRHPELMLEGTALNPTIKELKL